MKRLEPGPAGLVPGARRNRLGGLNRAAEAAAAAAAETRIHLPLGAGTGKILAAESVEASTFDDRY